MQTKNAPAPQSLLSALDSLCSFLARQSRTDRPCTIEMRPYAKSSPPAEDITQTLSAHVYLEVTRLCTLLDKELRAIPSLKRLTPSFRFYANEPAYTLFSVFGKNYNWDSPFNEAGQQLSQLISSLDAILARHPRGPLKTYEVRRKPAYLLNTRYKFHAASPDEAIALYAFTRGENPEKEPLRGIVSAHLINPDAQ